MGNKNKKILVLGASGMLGAMVFDVMAQDPDITLGTTVRDPETRQSFLPLFRGAPSFLLNAKQATYSQLETILSGYDWVINCIGITKPYTHEEDSAKIVHAVQVNTLFSHLVGHVAQQVGAQVLQIATDCVYDGTKGMYTENDPHNALDVYGKTKSLGEIHLPNVHHLRCSIVGPEPRKDIFLLAWLLNQPGNAKLKGYTNHQWNGVTTLHFARFCHGIISGGLVLGHIQHIIPGDALSKYELLKTFAKEFHREDLEIEPVAAGTVIDRTLATVNRELNQEIWKNVGYEQPPDIKQMVAELAHFKFSVRKSAG